MTSPSWLAVRVRQHTFMPFVAGSIVLIVSAMLSLLTQRREDAESRRLIGVKARTLATVVSERLRERNKELERLAHTWPKGSPDPDVWDSEALHVIQTGAFRSLAWIDANDHVVAAVPDERIVLTAPDAALAAQHVLVTGLARSSGRLTNSTPVVASSGVPVVISAAPVVNGQAVIVGETGLSTLLRRALETEEAAGYSVSVFVGSQLLFSRVLGEHALEQKWAQDVAVGDAGSEWHLRAWPASEELARRDSRLPESLFFIGTLFAVTIAFMMQMYQTAERRAHALSRANRLLESEIKGRERAQEALERSEEQLRQSQKMEAVGRLAGGVAHDFNNLLTAINGYADFLLADIDRTDPRRDDVREIKKAATRAGALTAQLLAFSRRQIRQPRPLDLNAVLSGLDRMLRRVIGEDVKIDWNPAERLGSVLADPSEIEQVMLNLIVNASDAMPNGGTITVRTSCTTFDDDSHPQLGQGRYVCLSVRDTGVGMDADTRSRIFEPFFTTKEAGKGTGLGLSTVYAIVEGLHGAVDVESTVGVGTSFIVHLPLQEAPAESLTSGTLATIAPRGIETVLLVEDEEGVRALGSRILERHGYTVLEARNGREALSLVSQHGGPIDLLLTDVVMPEMGGKQLANAMLERDTAIRVLFMSGYTDGDISRRGELDPNTAFLQKPFSARALLSRVREVLDEDAIAAA